MKKNNKTKQNLYKYINKYIRILMFFYYFNF